MSNCMLTYNCIYSSVQPCVLFKNNLSNLITTNWTEHCSCENRRRWECLLGTRLQARYYSSQRVRLAVLPAFTWRVLTRGLQLLLQYNHIAFLLLFLRKYSPEYRKAQSRYQSSQRVRLAVLPEMDISQSPWKLHGLIIILIILPCQPYHVVGYSRSMMIAKIRTMTMMPRF